MKCWLRKGLAMEGLAGRGAVPYPNCRRAMSSLPRGRQARTHGLLLLVSLQPLAQTCVKPAHIVLVHGYAIDASVDRPHELREGRPVVGILGRRVADQGE